MFKFKHTRPKYHAYNNVTDRDFFTRPQDQDLHIVSGKFSQRQLQAMHLTEQSK